MGNQEDHFEWLSSHRLLAPIPEFERRWVLEHGDFKHEPQGSTAISAGEKADYLWFVLSGTLVIYVDRRVGPRRCTEWKVGAVSGWMPYSRLVPSPGNVIAIQPSDIFRIHRGYGPAMISECPTVTEMLVHVMVERARTFKVSEQ